MGGMFSGSVIAVPGTVHSTKYKESHRSRYCRIVEGKKQEMHYGEMRKNAGRNEVDHFDPEH